MQLQNKILTKIKVLKISMLATRYLTLNYVWWLALNKQAHI